MKSCTFYLSSLECSFVQLLKGLTTTHNYTGKYLGFSQILLILLKFKIQTTTLKNIPTKFYYEILEIHQIFYCKFL